MSEINIVVIPYRDMYFWQRYGSAVRDLQLLELLTESKFFKNIYVINRPVSLYERVLSKLHLNKTYPGVTVIDNTSFDIISPLQGRGWARSCYSTLLYNLFNTQELKNKKFIVLDFSPFMILDFPLDDNIILWHDMIDNFTKHNRFTQQEQQLVRYKYQHISDNYHILTGVTREAINAIPHRNSLLNRLVVSNGVFHSRFESVHKLPMETGSVFDFGFIGFVTNKLDVEFVSMLARDYSIVVYGDSLDKSTTERLNRVGVAIMGGFKYSDLPSIMSTFRIGLLPYLIEKSHDGSPLKLYEYFKYNKPCLTTINYELEGPFIVNANKTLNLDDEIKRLMTVADSNCISESLPNEAYLKIKFQAALELAMRLYNHPHL